MGTINALDPTKFKQCDASVKNKFSEKWLAKKVSVVIGKDTRTVTIGDEFVKVDIPGQALCKLCTKHINYGIRGAVALEDHIKSTKHSGRLKETFSSYRVDSMMKQFVDDSKPGPSSTAEDANFSHTSTSVEPPKPILTSMCDRVSNAEALLLATMSEHSMPFTYAPILVNLAQALAEDPKSLSQLSIDRCTASYKTRHGLALGFQEKIVHRLQTQPFSLNIDESTSNSNKHILTALVSFNNDECVVCEHWTSVELTKVDSETIFNVLVDLIEKNEIPWTNFVSVLMDSCNVMRGKKSGVETRLNEKAPHLLDIDGDSCHHVHNSCKKLCAPFEGYLEHLFTDLYNDFKWSSDLCEFMAEVCEVLGIKFTKPERFVAHRWLSAYDIALSTQILMDAYVVFYYAFLGKSDRTVYLSKILEVCKKRNVPKEGRDRLREIRLELSKKKMTDYGKDRKKRIVEKIFCNENKTDLQMSFYQEALPILKRYVMTFQSKDVLVHQLHDKQLETFRNFLACFIKPEFIVGKSAKQLQEFDLDNDEDEKYLKMKDMYVGIRAKNVMNKVERNYPVVKEFQKTVSAAYVLCALHMQKTLPLNSKILRALSCCDPLLKNDTEGMKGLEVLFSYFSFMLTEAESECVLSEIRSYVVDTSIHCESDDIVQWWRTVDKKKKYPSLCKIVFAALTIFHGPIVEGSFNIMGDVIGAKTASLNVETYSAIQTIKYGLKARKTNAVKMFRRNNPVSDPVDKHLCIKLRLAASEMKKQRQEAKKDRENRLRKVGKEENKLLSKVEMKNKMTEKHKTSYASHVETELQRAKKRLVKASLENLCVKRKRLEVS